MKQYLYPIIIIVVFAISYAFLFDAKMDFNGDNVTYYMLGKALAEGKGYVNQNLPEPTAHSHFPPGYPVLISAVFRVFPRQVLTVKATNGILLLLSLLLLYSLSHKLLDHGGLALLITLMSLGNVHLMHYGMKMMSEIPFLMFSLLSLWAFVSLDRERPPWKQPRFYVVLIAVIICFYLRSLGLCLFLGIGLYLAFYRQWKSLGVLIVGFFMAVLPWTLRNQSLGGSSYGRQFLRVNPYRPELGEAGLSDFLTRFWSNTVRYTSKEIPSALVHWSEVDYKSSANGLAYLLGFLFIVLIAYGMYSLPKFRGLLFAYILCTFGVLLIWPSQWYGTRFMLPLIPILILCAFYGTYRILLHIFPKQLRWYWLAPLLLALGPGLYLLRQKSLSNYESKYNNYRELAQWVQQKGDEGIVVACRKPIIFHVLSGVKTLRYSDTEDTQVFLQHLERHKVSYVVLDGMGYISTEKYLIPALKQQASRFESKVLLRGPDTELFEFKMDADRN